MKNALSNLLRQAALIALLLGAVTSVYGQQPTLLADTTTSVREWNDFYHSRPYTFQPHAGYRIVFDYKILSSQSDTAFYMVVNDESHANKTYGFQEWTGQAGNTGHIHTIFINWDGDNYTFVIGIHNKGKIAVSYLSIERDPQLQPEDRVLPDPVKTWTSPGHAAYYVDSRYGNDKSTGRAPNHAWRSLKAVNSGLFRPGDRIYLARGSHWDGYLALTGDGALNLAIMVSPYGTGANPRVDGHGDWLASLYLLNSSFITVRGLELTNRGRIPQPKMFGVEVAENNVGTAKNITLESLYVHDVTGSELKQEGGGGGIDCSCEYDRRPTRFDGLNILNCHLTRTDRNGITISGPWIRDAWFPSLHVIVEHNLLEDIGGDGIVPVGCDGAIIAHNTLSGGRKRTPDYAAGIWPWSCDNTIVEFNQVSDMNGTNDGQAFDSDWNCRNSLFEYNFSRNNDGGFILVCDDGSKYPPYNAGNSETIIRYNVSVDDGHYIFNLCGPADQNKIYNNTVYINNKSVSKVVDGGYWGGWTGGTSFTNNLVISMVPVAFDLGGMSSITFLHNAFAGQFIHRPAGVKTILLTMRPSQVAALETAPDRILSIWPILQHAGAFVANNGGRDYAGNPVPASKAPSIGALQK
jgi:hypothetical protein